MLKAFLFQYRAIIKFPVFVFVQVDPKGTTIMAGFSNGSFRIFDLKLSENGVFTLFLKQVSEIT